MYAAFIKELGVYSHLFAVLPVWDSLWQGRFCYRVLSCGFFQLLIKRKVIILRLSWDGNQWTGFLGVDLSDVMSLYTM